MDNARKNQDTARAAPVSKEGAQAGRATGPGDESIPQRFDRLCKVIFACRRMFVDCAACLLTPAAWAALDWQTLQSVDSEHVSVSNRSRRSDLVWTVRHANGRDWVCFLLEFQSRVDRWMALRLQDCVNLVLRKMQPPGRRAPLVLPVVFHTGRSRWTAPLSLDENSSREPREIWRERARLRYRLVDMRRYRGRGLRLKDNFAASLLRMVAARNVRRAWRELQELERMATDEETRELGNAIARLFVLLAELWGLQGLLDELFKLLGDDKITLEGVNRTMAEIPEQRWRQPIVEEGRKLGRRQGRRQGRREGRELGRQEGRQEGREAGREEGRKELLAKQAEARFGRQHARTLSKLLRSVESVGRLDEVGLWLVECDSFDALATRLKAA